MRSPNAFVVVVGVLCALVACTSKPAEQPKTPEPKPAASTSTGPHFLHDEIDAAFAEAKRTNKLVFVDAWAPWCHTCLSMQRDVLSSPALVAWQDRVVFAAVDTDKPGSSSFAARFPMRVWPTFFAIDPHTEQVLALHGGSLSLPELTAFLEAAQATRDPAKASDPRLKALLAGHQASSQKNHAAAAAFYVDAAGLDGPPPARQSEAILGAIRAYAAAKDDDACIAFGLKVLPQVRMSGASSDVVGYLTSCADRLKEGDPRKAEVLTIARARLEELAKHPQPGASVDDHADTLAILADVADAQKDKAAHDDAHVRRLALLEADANSRTNVDDARVHDYARMNSYLALGRGDDAVTLLRTRTTQLPTSYEAWARLASALHQLKRDDEARPAALKAIEHSYGPRRLRYRTLLADIEAARKDPAGERQAVQALVDDADQLPPGQRDEAAVVAAKARLAALP
ncbi:MAG: thioredoxin family protein [Deltaproteobacteria bacterium]|nr:thioredoxin family protein [Deltaproteobacteria bacterium]